MLYESSFGLKTWEQNATIMLYFCQGDWIMKFSEEIKNIRKCCLLSQEDFAREIGVSYSTVNRWEKGKTLPTYKAMKSIERFCVKWDICFVDTMISWKEER